MWRHSLTKRGSMCRIYIYIYIYIYVCIYIQRVWKWTVDFHEQDDRDHTLAIAMRHEFPCYNGNNDRTAWVLFVQRPREQGEWLRQIRSGFDCIIRPASSGVGRTTPSPPGHYHPNISYRYIYIYSARGTNIYIYVYIYSVRGTKFPNLNVSRLVLQLFLSNPLKPGVKSSMKMQQATLQLYVSDHHFIAYYGAAYVRGLTILSLFFHLCIHTHTHTYIYIYIYI